VSPTLPDPDICVLELTSFELRRLLAASRLEESRRPLCLCFGSCSSCRNCGPQSGVCACCCSETRHALCTAYLQASWIRAGTTAARVLCPMFVDCLQCHAERRVSKMDGGRGRHSVGDPLLSSSREPPQDSERPAALRESCESLMLLAARKRTKAAQQEGPKVASKLSTSLKETASSSLSSSMAAIVSAAITYQVLTRGFRTRPVRPILSTRKVTCP